MISLDSTTLTYDALGRMVEQNQSGTYFQIVYSPRGKKLAIMKAQVIQQAFLPLPGKAKAEYLSWGLSHYRHPDWLGSSRLESSTTHGIVQSVAYDAFGVPYAQKSGGNGELSFTEQNKDTAWLQYDFLDRQYDPTQGRWLSPDPAGLAAVDPTTPQSWNRYAYVMNNPLALVDPFGDDACYDGNGDAVGGTGGVVQGICDSLNTGAYNWVPGEFEVSVQPTGAGVSYAGPNGELIGTSDATSDMGLPALPGTSVLGSTFIQASYFGGSPTTQSPYSTGCIVAASCGPTANTHGMSHCTVTVGQNGKYTAYDGGPTGSIWNSRLQVQSGAGGPPGPDTFFISDSCSMAGCVPRVAQNINKADKWYSFPFQNSNTAAGMMLNQCGANVTLPVLGPQ